MTRRCSPSSSRRRERLVDRHLGMAKEWFPHELVEWRPPPAAGSAEVAEPLPDGVASALFVNVLTEDNLPYYFASIDNLFGRDGAWGYWTRRWTAEEGRHSIVLRDYLIMSGHLDPVTLERARMAQVTGGVSPQADEHRRRVRLSRPPGAGHPDRPPQHGQGAARRRGLRGHEAGGGR